MRAVDEKLIKIRLTNRGADEETPWADEAFEALSEAAEALDIIVEGAWGPRDGDPGRIYFAALRERDDRSVMADLLARDLPVTLSQIHPARAPEAAPAVNLLPAKGKK